VSRLTLFTLQLLVAVAAVLLWQVLTTVPVGGVKLLPPFFFSTPSDVAARIVKWFIEGTIWKHLWITLVESVLAFVIGSVAGVLIGFWFAQQPRVAAVFDPYVKMINALPRVVLAPIFALWLGLGEGRARRHARVLHRVLQRVSRREGGEPNRARQCPYARHERAGAHAPRVLAFRAFLDVLLASYRRRLCRRRRRRR
jgi:ABC-type amino acid transport system permease subunit